MDPGRGNIPTSTYERAMLNTSPKKTTSINNPLSFEGQSNTHNNFSVEPNHRSLE